MASFLALLRLCWEIQQTFCEHACGYIQEKLDYLCILFGLQVLPHTSSYDKDTRETKTREESVEKDTKRATVCGHYKHHRQLKYRDLK